MADSGMPSFRAGQVWRWLYSQGAGSFDDMTDLPLALRSSLAANFSLSYPHVADVASAPDSTLKLLLEFHDGEKCECVVIPSVNGNATLCVSSQAGCAFGCAFCATGTLGLKRNLSTGEIVAQFFAACKTSPLKIDHIVFMGMGEPFANYDNVLKAVHIFNDGDGLAIGARRITLSTCGVVAGIERLASEGIQVELAVSLHASNDALRSKLMPVNVRWPIATLLDACRKYNAETKRIVTFEYTLVAGLNDTRRCATELAGLLSPSFARVNLIPLSPVPHFDGSRPSPARCHEFAATLKRSGLNVTLRNSKGASLAAACGQLRATNHKDAQENGKV